MSLEMNYTSRIPRNKLQIILTNLVKQKRFFEHMLAVYIQIILRIHEVAPEWFCHVAYSVKDAAGLGSN